MEVEYTLSVEDVLAFQNRNKPKKNRAALRTFWFLVVAYGVCIGLVYLSQERPIHVRRILPWLLAAVAAAGVVVWLVVWWWPRYCRKQIERELREMFAKGPYRMALAADGVYVLSADTQSFFRWSAIQAVQRTPRQAFLILGQSTGHIVPRRAFAGSTDYEAFVDLACRYHEQQGVPVMSDLPVHPAVPDAVTTKPIQDRLA